MSARPHLWVRSRWRLLVLQVLMISLFVTLLSRLFYLQVPAGAEFAAQATDQSVREIVTQPTRGLIVDDMGRSLVANRTSWVVSLDRTQLGKLSATAREALLRRVAKAVDVPLATVEKRSLLCSESGAQKGSCWNGSPYQPLPVATDVSQRRAVGILERAEQFPGVLTEASSLRAYPSPYGINAAHVLGYLSPVTEKELDAAEKREDRSLNGASLVGRAGIEQQYDAQLRGVPGYKRVAVDSAGQVVGDDSEVAATPGSTLVTSLDAKVQAATERNLAGAISTARQTYDKVSGRRYEADSGAAIVLEAKTGRVVAMSSQPTYDPSEFVGGISQKQLDRLYSKKADEPLLSRATQGRYAPGSTWKPVMTVGALRNGYSTSDRLDCSSGLQVGNRWFKNYESGSFGYIGFDKALSISCDTFFYRIGLGFWQKYGADPADVNAKDPLVAEAKAFGFGKATGIDVPGETAGRIADRHWKQAYFEANKARYCRIAKRAETTKGRDDYDAYTRLFAKEFCAEGNYYRAGDAVNFSIGQGDTLVTPLQLARAYAAISNGGTLFAPRVAKAIVSPDGKKVTPIKPVKVGTVAGKNALAYVDQALTDTPKNGTLAWRFGGFPLDQVRVRGKTGTAEVHGKQSTSWVATYDKSYVVVMLVTQGGTGSGTSGPFVRHIWETLYGVEGADVDRAKAAIPGTRPPSDLPVFAADGDILPPVSTAKGDQP